MNLVAAVKHRKSIRNFKPDPVPKDVIEEILAIARRAPSAENSQPWEFTVITGDILDDIRQANIERLRSGAPCHPDLLSKGWPPGSVYRRRQIAIAKQLFQLMEISREDKKGRIQWMERGFRFFNAPAAIVILSDRSLPYPRPLFDMGALTQTICLVSLNYGLGTCISNQGIMYPDVLYDLAGIASSKRIIISIAIGYPDEDFPANRVVSTRDPLEAITTWRGFG
ncbi:MAG: nitroreductase [Desulfobacterales bacterium]|nr:MAG: nitroreductase [Desulfobacterales bacterium]